MAKILEGCVVLNSKTKDFEQIMRNIIETVYTTGKLPCDYCERCSEQLAECIERKFIRGVSFDCSMSNSLKFTMQNPVVTYKGLDFFENQHPNRKNNITLAVSIVAIILSGLSVAVAFLAAYKDIVETLRLLFG